MEIQIGDKVQIVESHYDSVRNGTQAEVIEIWHDHFGKGQHLFRLDLPLNKHFRNHEIKKVNASLV